MSSNKPCRHSFKPRYTSGVVESKVLQTLAEILTKENSSETAWQAMLKIVREYRQAKVYIADVCIKCGEFKRP